MAGTRKNEQKQTAYAPRRSIMNPVQQMELARLEHKERLEKFQSNYRLSEPRHKAHFSFALFSHLKLSRRQANAVHKAQHSLS